VLNAMDEVRSKIPRSRSTRSACMSSLGLMLACTAEQGQGHAATSLSVVGRTFMATTMKAKNSGAMEERVRMRLNEAADVNSTALTSNCTYRVQLQEPIWSRLVKVKEDFLIRKRELSQCDLDTLGPTTTMIRVQLDLWVGRCRRR